MNDVLISIVCSASENDKAESPHNLYLTSTPQQSSNLQQSTDNYHGIVRVGGGEVGCKIELTGSSDTDPESNPLQVDTGMIISLADGHRRKDSQYVPPTFSKLAMN